MVYKLEEDSQRVHIYIFTRDLDRIDALRGRINRSTYIRNLLQKMLNGIESQAKKKASPIEFKGDLGLGDEE